jgi:hypothetical protein
LLASVVALLACSPALAQAAKLVSHTYRAPPSPSSPAYTIHLALPAGAQYVPESDGGFVLKAHAAGQPLEVWGDVEGANVVRSDPSGRSSVLKQAGGAHGRWLTQRTYLVPGGINVYLIELRGGAAMHLCLQGYPQDRARDALIRAIAVRSSGSIG